MGVHEPMTTKTTATISHWLFVSSGSANTHQISAGVCERGEVHACAYMFVHA